MLVLEMHVIWYKKKQDKHSFEEKWKTNYYSVKNNRNYYVL